MALTGRRPAHPPKAGGTRQNARMPRTQALAHLNAYLHHFPDERPALQRLVEQLAHDPGDVFARHNLRGHITTSALVIDLATDCVLMIHHAALGRWLQPGGHHEGTEALPVSAAREAVEETGVTSLAAWPQAPFATMPLDIDSHAIPARPSKGEGAHVHHDFIYLFTADRRTPLQPDRVEVTQARWMPRAEFAALPEARFARLAAKWAAAVTPPAG